ncbi:MAG TPA: hypothetical protein VMP03_11945 [Methylomirabilota bacterium]|nr:hypothetical protein [Methylomirabilota bacterium]
MFHRISLALLAAVALVTPASAAGSRVQVTGEIVDTWCSVSGIMFAYGTAHHQCAVWCAVGGIPVSIRDEAGNTYMVLRIGDDTVSVANPKVVTIQSHQVTVDGELIERDGVKYLLVDQVADDKGIINLTHEEYGVVPFGE